MFSQWCAQNNLYTKDSSKSTHLLLNGGQLAVDEKIYEQFIYQYYLCLKRNEDVYLVERVSSEVKLFIDIDSKENEDTEKIVKHIKEILPFTCYEYKCSIKNGYHLIFPDQIHSPEACKQIVISLQNKLVKEYKYDKTKLSNIIDTSVYKTGLRAIGSYKRNEKRYYTTNNLKRTELSHDNIKQSLIRKTHDNLTKHTTPKINLNQTQNSVTTYNIFEKEIERLHFQYKNVKVTKIKYMGNDCFTLNTNSHFCMNKNAEHSQEVVYFVVDKNKKIYQKCFCSNNKTEQRQYGKCSQYRSKGYPFSWNAWEKLQLHFQ